MFLKVSLDNNIKTVNIPASINLNRCKKIRISTLLYTSPLAGQKELLVSINNFNQKVDITNNKHYFFYQPLSGFAGTPIIYNAPNNHYDYNNCENESDVRQLVFHIEIDGVLSGLSSLNKLNLELEFD